MTYQESTIALDNDDNTEVINQSVLECYAQAVQHAIEADLAFEKSFDPAWEILDEMSDKEQQKWLLENIGKPIAKRYHCEARLSKANGSVQFYHKGGIKDNKRHDAARKKYAYFIMTDAEKQEKLEREAATKKERDLQAAQDALAEQEAQKQREAHNAANQHLSNEEMIDDEEDEDELQNQESTGEVLVDTHTRSKPQSHSAGKTNSVQFDTVITKPGVKEIGPVNCTAHDLGIDSDYSEYEELADQVGIEFSIANKDDGEIEDYCNDLALSGYALNNISQIITIDILEALKNKISERINELHELENEDELNEEEYE